MSARSYGRDGLLSASPGPPSELCFRTFAWRESRIMCSMGWPMLISFCSRMAMASVDLAFVGHISDGVFYPGTYLAAAALSDMITGILVIPPLAFNQCLNTLIGQAMGSGNKKMAGTWLQLSIFWLTVAYIPVLFCFSYVSDMLRLLGFPADICHLAGLYARYSVFWPIPNGWYQCMRFYFQAQQITRPAMYNNLCFLGVNVLLNWVFVFGGPFRAWCGWRGLGFVGAAVSLSVSRSVQPLAYWLYMFVYRREHRATWPGWSFKFFRKTREFFGMALPQIGTLAFQATIGQSTTLLLAQLGPVALASSAATAALTQVFTGGLQPTLTAISGIRTGYWLGNGEALRASRVGWVALGLGCFATVLISAVLLPLSNMAVAMVTSDEDVQVTCARLLPAMMLNIFAGIAVQVGTGGVITSQGRAKLATFLSLFFELPLSLGSVAVLVLWFRAPLLVVYWTQALVTVLESVVVWLIVVRSNWQEYGRDAQTRQADAPSPAPTLQSPQSSSAPTTIRTPRASPMLGHPPTREILFPEPVTSSRGEVDMRLVGLSSSGVSIPERKAIESCSA